jgi:tetratricopeptide (TPR) repeat protein
MSFVIMQNHARKILSPKMIAGTATILLVGVSIGSYTLLAKPSNNPWQYRFQRPAVGSVTKGIQQEIAFHQQRIQQQPTAGLERAALASAYLRMARATGDSSWYLLAQQTAEQSLAQLSVHNHGAILVLAKVAAAKHDFSTALSLLKQVPPQAEALALSTTIQLALGNTSEAQKNADILVQRMPSVGNFALKALVEVAQGKDQDAIKDFKAAIAAEDAEEAGSSAWVRTLLGRFYYKRGELQKAEELYQSALQILPKYPPALLNSAELAVRQWQSNPSQTHHLDKANAVYQQFFSNNQQAPTVYDHVALRGLARVQKLRGEITLANKTWERAIARLRSDIDGFGHRRELAQLLLERGEAKDRAEALTLMQAEVKVRQDPETWDTLAAVYFQMEQLPAAEQAMQKALKSGILDPGIFDRAAAISTARGDIAQAQKYQELVKSIDPIFGTGARQALGLGVGLSGLN